MSTDLIFTNCKKSWARDDLSYKPLAATSPSPAKLVPTPGETARLRSLTSLRARAESGDAKARKEWQVMHAKVAALRVRARGGDPKALRACQILEDSGLFGKSPRSPVSGELVGRQEIMGRQEDMGSEEIMGAFVGDEERLARDAGPAERDASARISGLFSPRSVLKRIRSRKLKADRRSKVWRATRGSARAFSDLQNKY